MKITRCAGVESHFFDGEKYSTCPVCGAGPLNAASGNDTTVMQTPVSNAEPPVEHNASPKEKQGKRFGLFHHEKKKSQTVDETVMMEPVDSLSTGVSSEKMTEDRPSENGFVRGENVEDVYAKPQYRQTEQQIQSQSQYQQSIQPQYQQPAPDVRNTISQMVPPQPEGPSEADRKKAYDAQKTVGIYHDVSSEPVVGWLVCIKGESVGESFNLKAGKNNVGRGAGMDVALINEPTVNRDKHAVIIYEPKKRVFYLQPGDANGLVYLNEEFMMAPAQLTAGDNIQLGEAVFRFVPLCGPDFVWDDYIGN